MVKNLAFRFFGRRVILDDYLYYEVGGSEFRCLVSGYGVEIRLATGWVALSDAFSPLLNCRSVSYGVYKELLRKRKLALYDS